MSDESKKYSEAAWLSDTELQARNDWQAKELLGLVRKLSEKNALISDLQAIIDRQSARIDDLRVKLTNAVNDRCSHIDSYQASISALIKGTVADQDARIMMLESQLETSDKRLQLMAMQIVELTREIAALRAGAVCKQFLHTQPQRPW
jgi:hypothetical protein